MDKINTEGVLKCSEHMPEYGLFTGIKEWNIQILARKTVRLGKPNENSTYWMVNTQKRNGDVCSHCSACKFFLRLFPHHHSIHLLRSLTAAIYRQPVHAPAYFFLNLPILPFKVYGTKPSPTLPNRNSMSEFHFISSAIKGDGVTRQNTEVCAADVC